MVGLSISPLHSVHNPNWMLRIIMAVVFSVFSITEGIQTVQCL